MLPGAQHLPESSSPLHHSRAPHRFVIPAAEGTLAKVPQGPEVTAFMAFPCAASEPPPVSLSGPVLGCAFVWGCQTLGVGPRWWTENVDLIGIWASHLSRSLSDSRAYFTLAQKMIIKPTEWKAINLDVSRLSGFGCLSGDAELCLILPAGSWHNSDEHEWKGGASRTLPGQTVQIADQNVGAPKASGDDKTGGGYVCWGLHWYQAQCFAMHWRLQGLKLLSSSVSLLLVLGSLVVFKWKA